MSLISQLKPVFQLYCLSLKDYYTQEAPYRLLNVTSYFFPFTTPFCQRTIDYIRGKGFEILSEETLKEEEWSNLEKIINETKRLFGIEEEIFIAKDLSGKIPSYGICSNIIIVNEKKAFTLKDDAQKFAITHELSHYVHRHLDKRTYMNCVWIVIDLSCLALAYYKSPLYFLALGVAEIGIFHIERAAFRYQEKEADLTAIDKLHSNQGAKENFNAHLMFDAIHFLNVVEPNLKKLPVEEMSQDLLIDLGLNIHRSALDTATFTHPPYDIRLQYCGIQLK